MPQVDDDKFIEVPKAGGGTLKVAKKGLKDMSMIERIQEAVSRVQEPPTEFVAPSVKHPLQSVSEEVGGMEKEGTQSVDAPLTIGGLRLGASEPEVDPNRPLPPQQASIEGGAPQQLPQVTELPSASVSGFDKGFDLQAQGINQMAAAQALEGAKQAGQHAMSQQIQDDLIESQQKREEERKNLAVKRSKEIEGLNEEIAQKSEFKDFWETKSTGNRILAALSIGLGSVSQGLIGGQNTALGIIHKAIERDTARQRGLFEAAKDKKKEVLGAYGLEFDRLRDADAAEANVAAQKYRKVELKLKELAATSTSEKVKANALSMLGQIEINRADKEQRAVEAGMKTVEARHKAEKDLISRQVEIFTRDESGKLVPQIAKNEKQASKVNDLNVAYRKLKAKIAEARAHRESAGRAVFPGTDEAFTGKALGKDLITSWNVLQAKLGALTDEDRALIEDTVPNDVGAIFGGVDAKLDVMERIVDNNFGAELKAFGLRPESEAERARD